MERGGVSRQCNVIIKFDLDLSVNGWQQEFVSSCCCMGGGAEGRKWSH